MRKIHVSEIHTKKPLKTKKNHEDTMTQRKNQNHHQLPVFPWSFYFTLRLRASVVKNALFALCAFVPLWLSSSPFPLRLLRVLCG
jgi:hypothetical protein